MTFTMLFDLSKAFDVINHGILIKKLEFYGIRGKEKDWIINYLTDRAQYVQIDSHMSEQCKIKWIPHDSLLLPMLN